MLARAAHDVAVAATHAAAGYASHGERDEAMWPPATSTSPVHTNAVGPSSRRAEKEAARASTGISDTTTSPRPAARGGGSAVSTA